MHNPYQETKELTEAREPSDKCANCWIKRVFDIVFSLFVLVFILPVVFIITAIAIKLSSPGPILFVQKRTGLHGEDFNCYKFRSMRINAASDILQARENDPRKTKVGNFLRKTNIDELPQFWNVLMGHMSVVGPRPHMLKHTEDYSGQIRNYMNRHLVKPGITGLAQVRGFRGETKELHQMTGRIRLDIWYIQKWTFGLDLLIIWKTIYNVIKGERLAY